MEMITIITSKPPLQEWLDQEVCQARNPFLPDLWINILFKGIMFHTNIECVKGLIDACSCFSLKQVVTTDTGN
jgi:hypothetical protein